MWKQFKKEIIVGGIMIGMLSFALGCVFSDSTLAGNVNAGKRIEQKADNGMPPDQSGPGNGQCPGNGQGPGNGQDGSGSQGQPDGKGPQGGFRDRGPRGGFPGGSNGQSDGNQNQTPGQQQDDSGKNQNPGQQQDDSTQEGTTENQSNTTQKKV